jgi:hypothetical protein
MKRILAVAAILCCGALAQAAETPVTSKKAAPKRATADDLAATLSNKPGTSASGQAKATAVDAGTAALADAKIERRIVEGHISTVTKRAINVEYETKGSESFEMMLPLAAQVKVEGAAALADLKRGDRVKVGIEQTYRQSDKGERVILKTEALVVALVQRAPETLTTSEEVTTP